MTTLTGPAKNGGQPGDTAQQTTPVLAASERTLLTVEAAAAQLSIGRTTMYALLKTGDIASVRVGRLRRVPADALAAYTARLLTEQTAA